MSLANRLSVPFIHVHSGREINCGIGHGPKKYQTWTESMREGTRSTEKSFTGGLFVHVRLGGKNNCGIRSDKKKYRSIIVSIVLCGTAGCKNPGGGPFEPLALGRKINCGIGSRPKKYLDRDSCMIKEFPGAKTQRPRNVIYTRDFGKKKTLWVWPTRKKISADVTETLELR